MGTTHTKSFGWYTVLLLALSGGCAWAQSLVIKHVTIIDATGRSPAPNMTVVVDGDRIVAISPAKKKTRIPKDAAVVDGTGKFLIPGLWDMHVHGASDERAPWSHLLFLANGVVGVRDMSGPPDARAWRATQLSNEDPSPSIYLGSPIVDGPIRYGPIPLSSRMKYKRGKSWIVSNSVVRISSKFTAGFPARRTLPSPTKQRNAASHSKATCRNR